ncbi:class I histocompatibility antigen, F10 alpha chain-like isoform X2 [Neoarius graeffei]|nr:class I histocompatibility antigen, F10 alpha chain-like isoform X2 [Neoarius graeffei]
MNFPEYTDVGLVDGELFVYYDSNIRKYIPKTEWIQKVTDSDADYWNSGTQNQQAAEEVYKEDIATLMQRFNQTEGVHTLQRLYGCEIDDDGTVRGYDQLGYDGDDFISLDLKSVTWTAAKPQAVITKNKLDATGTAHADKHYLENRCIEWLQKYVSYSREILERKVRPEVSVFQKHSSPEVVCHATGFFPKSVNITWQKDGEDVYVGVELSETLPNHDGSFQKRSVLKVPAEALQKHNYTCVVQHSSLQEEIVMPVSQILRGQRNISSSSALSGTGSWRQQSKQGSPNFPFPRHLGQLLGKNTEAFPGQPRDIVPPACPGSSPGPPPGGTCLEHLPREASRRHPKKMPEPPQLIPLDVEQQRLYSELLPNDCASHPISKGAPSHPAKETHFGRLYPRSCPFGHYPKLMTIGESRNVDRPVN